MKDQKCIDIDRKSAEKILSQLNEIKIVCADKGIKSKVEKIIDLANNEIAIKMEPSLEDVVYDKMKETKISNPDLSSKLYILYRKITQGKISEEEAKEMYETYIMMEGFDKMVW
ncbi:hypothetical protein [Clostridium oceanicum]|uniref:Uncharacterized protein n=1 Tax=Clostridium oceanicum TaxID=1543 RepID=A0ABP3V4N3_9CLOT